MIETRACTFDLDPRGFVRATMRDGVEMELHDAKEALAATKQLASGALVPVLVDSRGVKYQTKQAREYFVSEEAAAVCSRVAILVESPVSRMIGNFFLRNSNHRAPTKLFSDVESAAAWLMSPEG